MPKCTFCKKQYEFPRGLTVVRGSDGMVRYFCSSKCRKNFIMGRDNKKVNWVRKYKVSKEQEIEALLDAPNLEVVIENNFLMINGRSRNIQVEYTTPLH